MLLFSLGVQSAEVKGLYDALVPVADRSVSARSSAVKAGFKQVIAKITGSAEIAHSSMMAGYVSQANQYLNGYSYQLGPDKQLLLKANYSPFVVDKLIRKLQLPIWPSDRQPILVWMVVDDVNFGRQLVGSEANPELVQNLLSVASDRAQPLVFPVLDLQDRISLKPEDAWLLDELSIAQASKRYQASNWLVIRYFQTTQGQWRATTWFSGEQFAAPVFNDFQHQDLSALFLGVLNFNVDQHASQYVYTPQNSIDFVSLSFSGVVSHQAYKQLKGYLDQLEIVTDVQLVSLQNDTLMVNVSVEGQEDIFFAALERNQQLGFEGQDPRGRSYRWLGE